jgi:hypothetical protein
VSIDAVHKVEVQEAAGVFEPVAQRSPAEELALGTIPVDIQDGAGLELISGDQLSAVVSRVPLAEYGESSLAENLKDATWTAVRAMRHEQVVEFFAKRTGVVPLRFGTIISTIECRTNVGTIRVSSAGLLNDLKTARSGE